MTRFRNPGQREAAWGKWYAKRGLTAADVLAPTDCAYPEWRLAAWRAKYERIPMELKVGRV